MTRSTNHPGYFAFLTLLRAERRRLGVTQAQLAAKLGNRQTFVSKIETGDRRLGVVELFEYLDSIGSDSGDFLGKLKRKLKNPAYRSDRKLALRPATLKRSVRL